MHGKCSPYLNMFLLSGKEKMWLKIIINTWLPSWIMTKAMRSNFKDEDREAEVPWIWDEITKQDTFAYKATRLL